MTKYEVPVETAAEKHGSWYRSNGQTITLKPNNNNYAKHDSGIKEKSYQSTPHCSYTSVSNESDNNIL